MGNSGIMTYKDGMEIIKSDVMDRTLALVKAYDPKEYTAADVLNALSKEILNNNDFGALLSPAADGYLEEMAVKAKKVTARHFGNSIGMFTPLYIANYCENGCLYCGFNCRNRIRRAKLSAEEIETEIKCIAGTGLKETLILTGESRTASDVEYIGAAAAIAKKYCSTVGVEIYPLNTDEYAYLNSIGVDYVSVYQETYDLDEYDRQHPFDNKRVFPYRFDAQERALKGGMRGVNFGALLGLSDFRKDAYAVGTHAAILQSKYPHAEIGFSVPRLRPYINNADNSPKGVRERQLLQVMLSYRLFAPYAGITISTRESSKFRDNVIGVAATKISAGVNVGVGGHDSEQKGDKQFDIADGRNVRQIAAMLKERGLQAVYTDASYLI